MLVFDIGNQFMEHYTQYLHYHVGLLKEFKEQSRQQSPFSSDTLVREEDHEWLTALEELSQLEHYTESAMERGQWLIGRVVSTYSHLMPLLSRDLLWFFGGDCLHYMPDEEIAFYQQLDELRFAAEEANKPFDYADAKTSLTQSH